MDNDQIRDYQIRTAKNLTASLAVWKARLERAKALKTKAAEKVKALQDELDAITAAHQVSTTDSIGPAAELVERHTTTETETPPTPDSPASDPEAV